MTSVPWANNLGFGAGYDAVRGEAMQVGVGGVPAPPAKAAGMTGDFSLVLVQSSEDFDTALDIDADVGGGVGLFSGNAKFDYKRRCKVSNQATFCVVRALAINAYEQLTAPALTPEAWDYLAADKKDRFRARFGDRFVSGQVSGVEFFGVVRIEAKEESHQLEIASKVQASYALAVKGSASVGFEESMSSSEHRIEITTYQRGGTVETCADVGELMRLAQKALEAGRNGLAYPFAVELDPYSELKLPNDEASLVDVEFARAQMRRFSEDAQALARMANDIDFVLRNQAWFEGFDVATLNAAARQIANELNTIRERANTCSRDFAKCVAYAPNYPAFEMPPRKAGAPTAGPTTTTVRPVPWIRPTRLLADQLKLARLRH